MKVTKQETLYHKDHGATLKHKCGKKDSNIAPSLNFSKKIILVGFFGLFFIWASLASFIFHKVRRLIPTCEGVIASIIFSSLGKCSNNDDHHSFIYLQLNITTRYLERRYDSHMNASGGVPGCAMI